MKFFTYKKIVLFCLLFLGKGIHETTLFAEEKTPKTEIKMEDVLLEKSSLALEEVYPREDLNIGPFYLTEIKNPLQFSIKPYLNLGVPVFPAFAAMEQAGLDLFAGIFHISGGVHLPGLFGKQQTLRIDMFASWFASSAAAGLSNVSNGVLTGDTSLTVLGFSATEYIYLLDYFFVGIGGGYAQHRYSVEYARRDIFINERVVSLQDVKKNVMAPLADFVLGADIPMYQSLRAQISVEYQLHFFQSQLGAYIIFHGGLHYLF